MISGRQALATVEQTIAQARDAEVRLGTALRSAQEEAVRLRAARMEAFRDLARLKLDALSHATVTQELGAIERRALALLHDAKRAYDEFAGRRGAAHERLRQAETERHAKAAEWEHALSELEALRTRVEAETRVSPEWAACRARIDDLRNVTEAARQKTVQAEVDREEKRKPYESDPLFMYLWKRRFGTSGYTATGLVRFLDRKVARLVRYDKARADYALLLDIPLRLREHAARVKSDLGAEEARLVALEREALIRAGAEPLQAKAAQAKAGLEEAERNLETAKAAVAQFEAEGAASPAEMPYRESVELLARAAEAKDLQLLYREAAATPTPEDEAIVRRIEETEAAIGRAEREIGRIRGEMAELARRRAQIEHERNEFRRRGYDSPGGSFGNEQVLSNVLGGVLGGVLGSAVLRDVMNQGYRPGGAPSDSDFGGGAFPMPPDGGGGFDGGGMGGDDGFNTGGQF